jgi:hypothetical protein
MALESFFSTLSTMNLSRFITQLRIDVGALVASSAVVACGSTDSGAPVVARDAVEVAAMDATDAGSRDGNEEVSLDLDASPGDVDPDVLVDVEAEEVDGHDAIASDALVRDVRPPDVAEPDAPELDAGGEDVPVADVLEPDTSRPDVASDGGSGSDVREDPAVDVPDVPDVPDVLEDPAVDVPDVPDAAPPDPDGPPRFVLIEAGALAEHNPAIGDVRAVDYHYGFGIAPADVDGDGDLDLFVGTLLQSAQPACVYENVSTVGTPMFSRRADWCAPVGFNPSGATGVDMDEDGRHELIAYSERELRYVQFAPGWSDSRFPALREDCVLGAAMPHDIDQSGQLELLTACVIRHARPRAPSTDGDTWCFDAESTTWSQCPSRTFAVDENAIAIGSVDANDDGLLDIVSVCDTLGGPDAYDPTRDPGGWHLRCSPGSDCLSDLIRFAPGGAAWGSFMGFGAVATRSGWVGVLADIGPFGVFAVVGRSSYALDLAPELAWFRDESLDENLFSWGVVPGDWDDDGDDDIVMTFGRFARETQANDLVSRDTLFQQNNDTGAFEPATNPLLQFEPHTAHRDPRNEHTRVSRAAVQLDVDGDQRLELVIASVNGPPFVYQHLGASPRCTLRPTSRYVASWATGYEVKRGAWWVPLGGHGEVLSSDGPWLVVPSTSGQLRFPSGGVVDYDCGDAGTIDVVEPEWLSFTHTEGVLTAQIAASNWPGRVTRVRAAVERDDGVEVVEATSSPSGWVLEAPGAERVMWELNGRWVERWLPVHRD